MIKAFRLRTKWLRPIIWKAIRMLPKKYRHRLIRSYFPVPSESDQELEFKVADTKEELEQAFAILYEEFIAHNYIDPNEARLRITRYHALPTTAVLVGKLGGEVVCTITVIVDSALGLPSDASWDLNSIRQKCGRMAEISSLAIRRNTQGRRGKILLPLCKFLYEYCARYAEVDVMFISTLESVKDFYEAILLFEPLAAPKPLNNSFVKNVVAYGQYMDLRTANARFIEVYAKQPPERNLYDYFAIQPGNNFHFPTKRKGQIFQPVLTPDLLNYFFRQKLALMSQLTPMEQMQLLNSYQRDAYANFFETSPSVHSSRRSDQLRMPVKLVATLISMDEGRLQSVVLLDVSQSGFQARVEAPLALRQPLIIKVDIGASQQVRLEVQAMWKDAHGKHGFQIVGSLPTEWINFVEDMAKIYPLRDSEDVHSSKSSKSVKKTS